MGRDGRQACNFCYSAVILDLDGVVTATKDLHVRAWTRAFNEFLGRLRERKDAFSSSNNKLRPFDPVSDYENFVDGKPRLDGVRSFLASRGILLEEGRENDSSEPEMDTIQGLARRKNQYYLELLSEEGPHVFKDSIEALNCWRQQGIPLAVVTSSRNCVQVLQKADIEGLFGARVDGNVGRELGLRGKPEPDYFVEAAKRLGVKPSQALMVEDAYVGVEAGRRGGFGCVIGIDRSGQSTQGLIEHGADRVVSTLTELFEERWASCG